MTEQNELEDSDMDSLNEEEIVLEGFRRSRNRTNWLYRGTAMTSTDSMDVDELRLQASDFEVVLGHVVGAFVTLSVIARSRVEQGLSYRRIKEALDYICIAVSWITCYIEMLYLDIEDKIYYQHRLHRFNEPTMRSINNIEDDNQSESMFGFKKNELVMLYQHWRLPQEFLVQNRRFSSEAKMLLFLFYIRSSMAFT